MRSCGCFQVNDLAAGLVTMGLKKGDRVGMWGPNMREWVITQFATAKAGLVLVSIWYSMVQAILCYIKHFPCEDTEGGYHLSDQELAGQTG